MSNQYTIVIFIHGEAHPFKSLKKAEEFMKKMERKGIEYSTEADYDSDASSSEYDSDCSTSSSGLEYPDELEDGYEYYSDSDDEDIYDKMQLRRTSSGTLQFTKTYLETLQTGITASSAA